MPAYHPWLMSINRMDNPFQPPRGIGPVSEETSGCPPPIAPATTLRTDCDQGRLVPTTDHPRRPLPFGGPGHSFGHFSATPGPFQRHVPGGRPPTRNADRVMSASCPRPEPATPHPLPASTARDRTSARRNRAT